MAVQVSYPGVYVQEVPSGVRTITGVSTSVALFIGRTERGIQNKATRLFSYNDYVRNFGAGAKESEMSHQVRQFFTNGGTQAYIIRIASGATEAKVNLHNEATDVTLEVAAKEAGLSGGQLRIEIDYDTALPDATFNLRVFRQIDNGAGGFLEVQEERFLNLTMEQGTARYAVDVVSQQSTLISLQEPGGGGVAPVPRSPGILVAGRVLGNDPNSELEALISGGANKLRIDSGGGTQEVDLAGLTAVADIESAINAVVANSVNVSAIASVSGNNNLFLITNQSAENVSVELTGSTTNDFALAMQLGAAQGGIEKGADAERRPSPSGLFFDYGIDFSNLVELIVLAQEQITELAVNGTNILVNLETTAPGDPLFQGLASAGVESLVNVREKLLLLAQQFNDGANANPDFNWTVELQGMRVVMKPSAGIANSGLGAALTTVPVASLGDAFIPANTRYYSLGAGGAGDFQSGGTSGTDGSKPVLGDYKNAFDLASQGIDIFNLIVLPRDADDADDRQGYWGVASVFAQQHRAFLIVDPPVSWNSVSAVISGTSSNIGTTRRGMVKDHAAIYWPRLTIIDPNSNLSVKIDPSGTLAGLMARTDGNRGVWKAPAGVEAGLRAVRGIEHAMSDRENGVINPQAVNAIRVFPNGIVSWGARTMDGFDNSGNDDYKYVPVRRFALFLEESLYRGLKFAVFEPNDEPLWRQIRLAAGAFMNNLFRQGAFQGQKSSDAYFVKCDAETTTQNDINLGIVNVLVGFAPLKPAEFVVITVQQMAGQVQT